MKNETLALLNHWVSVLSKTIPNLYNVLDEMEDGNEDLEKEIRRLENEFLDVTNMIQKLEEEE